MIGFDTLYKTFGHSNSHFTMNGKLLCGWANKLRTVSICPIHNNLMFGIFGLIGIESRHQSLVELSLLGYVSKPANLGSFAFNHIPVIKIDIKYN